ncbi:MAG TPA: hypothetical protein V6C78_19065 [Crinalium sp.]|jgi:hypothetical protein
MNTSRSLRQFFLLSSVSNHIQDWIRKEIVDDDPFDAPSYFSAGDELSSETLSMNR